MCRIEGIVMSLRFIFVGLGLSGDRTSFRVIVLSIICCALMSSTSIPEPTDNGMASAPQYLTCLPQQ